MSTILHNTMTGADLHIPQVHNSRHGLGGTDEITALGGVAFSDFPTTPASDPSNPFEVANKRYVDTALARENLWDRVSGGGYMSPYYDGDGIRLYNGAGYLSVSHDGTFGIIETADELKIITADINLTTQDFDFKIMNNRSAGMTYKSGDTAIATWITSSADRRLQFKDGVDISLGNDDDLRIYHTGAAGSIDNIIGNLKLNPTAAQIITFFEDTGLIDGTDNGKALRVYRNSTTTTDRYITTYVDKWLHPRLEVDSDSTDFCISCGSGVLKLQYGVNGGDTKNITIWEGQSSGNSQLIMYGTNAGAGARKYVYIDTDDADDFMHIGREDTNWLGLMIDMPLEINTDSVTGLLVEQAGVNDRVFVVDSTNAKAGINCVNNPAFPWEVYGVGHTTSIHSGSVGSFSSLATADATIVGIEIDKDGYEAVYWGINKTTTTGGIPAQSVYMMTYGASGEISFGRGGGGTPVVDMHIDSTGKVGVGTVTPSELFDVGGVTTIDSTGVITTAADKGLYVNNGVMRLGGVSGTYDGYLTLDFDEQWLACKIGAVGGGSGSSISFTTPLIMEDTIRQVFGTVSLYAFEYASGSTQFLLWSTNVDGSGTNGNIFTVQDGVDDIVFNGIVKAVGGYQSGDGTQGTDVEESNVTDFNITIKDGLITSFKKN